MQKITEKNFYDSYKGLVQKKAWNFTKYGIEFDELEAQGNLIMWEASQKYDSSKGSFSNFLWTCLEYGLKQFAQKNFKKEEELENFNPVYEEKESFDIDGFKTNLSPESKYIIELALNPNNTLLSFRNRKDDSAWSTKINKSVITNYLRKNGWKYTTINQCFNEIEWGLQLNTIN